MDNLIQVLITEDAGGNKYIIPVQLEDKFYQLEGKVQEHLLEGNLQQYLDHFEEEFDAFRVSEANGKDLPLFVKRVSDKS